MRRKTPEGGWPRHRNSRWTLGGGLLAVSAVGLLGAGCGRTSAPVPHEVQRPIGPSSSSADLPIEISYPDVPDVPDKLRGPSAPIAGPTAGEPVR